MAKGVKTGGGSRKGKPNKASAAKAAEIAASGLTPLDYLLGVMRAPMPPELQEKLDEDEKNVAEIAILLSGWHKRRMDAACAAAPYVHPKLNAIQHTGAGDEPLFAPIINLIRDESEA